MNIDQLTDKLTTKIETEGISLASGARAKLEQIVKKGQLKAVTRTPGEKRVAEGGNWEERRRRTTSRPGMPASDSRRTATDLGMEVDELAVKLVAAARSKGVTVVDAGLLGQLMGLICPIYPWCD